MLERTHARKTLGQNSNDATSFSRRGLLTSCFGSSFFVARNTVPNEPFPNSSWRLYLCIAIYIHSIFMIWLMDLCHSCYERILFWSSLLMRCIECRLKIDRWWFLREKSTDSLRPARAEPFHERHTMSRPIFVETSTMLKTKADSTLDVLYR